MFPSGSHFVVVPAPRLSSSQPLTLTMCNVFVGDVVGFSVGRSVGDLVGKFVGIAVGNLVGLVEGLTVGDWEGLVVGLSEGNLVGDADGDVEGLALGCLVTVRPSTSQQFLHIEQTLQHWRFHSLSGHSVSSRKLFVQSMQGPPTDKPRFSTK